MKKKLVSLVLMLVVLLGGSMPSMALTGTPRNLNPGRSPISASQSEMSRNVDSIGGKMLSTVAILGGILLIIGLVVIAVIVIIVVIVVKNRSKKQNENVDSKENEDSKEQQ